MPSTSKLLLSALAVFGRRVEALPMSKHLSAFAPRKSVQRKRGEPENSLRKGQLRMTRVRARRRSPYTLVEAGARGGPLL